ncbi:hypothetical protein GCM10028805_58140 [Spirosoma harenae]
MPTNNLIQTREQAIAMLSSLQEQLSGTGLPFPSDLTPGDRRAAKGGTVNRQELCWGSQ